MVEVEACILGAEDHIFTYDLVIYGYGSKIFHVTTLDCQSLERSCESLAKEALIKFANELDLDQKELKWIANN